MDLCWLKSLSYYRQIIRFYFWFWFEMIWNQTSLQQPAVQFSDESRYLTPLWVSGTEEPSNEPCQSYSSQFITTCIEFRSESLFVDHHEIPYKIRSALKILALREEHVIVQFWSPLVAGKHQLLTTKDQPFGLGVVNEDLCSYRRNSEHQTFLVDKDHEEEYSSPPARVFRRGLPEWTSDVANYNTKDFPQQDCAIRCNLHGYLALPVFDPITWLCVGVVEILTSVNYTSYAFEVQRVHQALKAGNLTSPQVFDNNSKVHDERKQSELDKILGILKSVCDIHRLPLAQTWTVSPTSTFVSNNKVIEKACSSFDTRCIGKVCMSSAGLPFHVRDLGMWQFREACGEQHLDKGRGFVGKALLARGSCYCEDVTELSEDEYPLVHYARMSRLTSCFTIFLHSVEGGDNDDDYVLEFFLRVGNEDSRYLLNLVQTLKLEVGSGFELGEISPIAVIEIPKDASYLSSSIKPHTVQLSSIETANNSLTDSSDSGSILAKVAKTDSGNHPNEEGCTITDNVSIQKMKMKQSRKRKKDSLALETVEQHIGKSLGQTAEILGVSRSTLKRFCRKHGISSWPLPKHSKSNNLVNNPTPSQEPPPLQQSPSRCFAKPDSVYKVARMIIGLKRWRHKSFLNKRSYDAARSVSRVLDAGSLTVKANYKDDMVKFWFPVSGRLQELEKEVAERVNVKGQRLYLKYQDEEKDWVLISCDDDLEILAKNATMRLRVELADND